MKAIHKLKRVLSNRLAPSHHDNKTGLDIYLCPRKQILARNLEFELKGLGTHTAEVGLKCDTACSYCSVASSLRTHPAFRAIGRTAFAPGFAVIDPDAPEKLLEQMNGLEPSDEIVLCSKSDAWSPYAIKLKLGRKMLKAILENTDARVRIITKSALIRKDFDVIKAHRDRVTLGISITGLPKHDAIVKTYERNACLVSERIATMNEAARLGLRVFGMFCPLCPGLFSNEADIERLFNLAVKWPAEGIWTEIVNPRGPGIINCAQSLRDAGHAEVAQAFDAIRTKDGRSDYALKLTRSVQKVCRRLGLIDRLRVLTYRSSISDTAQRQINRDPEGIVWL